MNHITPGPVLVSRLKMLARFAALFSALMGFLVLVGWGFDNSTMKSLLPGLAPMKVNTALCIVWAGISLWLFAAQEDGKLRKRFALASSRILALIVFGIGLANLCEFIFGWNLHIDQLIFREPTPYGHSIAGRMAPHTALNFVILGCALILLRVETKRGYRPAQFLILIPTLISLTAIVGYLYSAVSFYHIASHTGMALNTAVGLFFLSFGVFFLYPDRGLAALVSSENLGGVIARRLLPAAFLAPLVIGWFGMEGQKAGLYGPEFGLALMVTLNVVVFTVWIYSSGKHIHQIAVARAEAEQAREELNFTLQALIDAFPLPVVAMDPEAKIQTWNRAAERVFGWSPLDVKGKSNPLVGDDRQDEYTTILEIMTQGDPVLGLGMVLVSRDEEKIPVVLWGAPIIIGTRGIFGFVTIMEDLRERNKLESKLKDLLATESPATV
jgi:PAS domain S-box-containing protein